MFQSRGPVTSNDIAVAQSSGPRYDAYVMAPGQCLAWFQSYLSGRTRTSQSAPISLATAHRCLSRFSARSDSVHCIHNRHFRYLFCSYGNLPYHMFADDTQMYDHCLISNIPILVDNFTVCINDLHLIWFNLPDEASRGDWLGLWSQADLNSPINDSSLCSLSK